MNSQSPPEPSRKQRMRLRIFWFLTGSVVNYLLISTPFKYLKLNTEFPIWAISACSLGISTLFFFGWNYFLNFRTDVRKRDAFPRYLGAVSLMWLLSSTTLTLLKHYDANMGLHVASYDVDLDIVATQFFLSGLKFFLYHKWVFPLADNSANAPAQP